MLIHDVVTAKGRSSVVTISPTASVLEMVGLLDEHNIGALVVSADGTTVDGIVSERDVVRRLHLDPDVLSATVESIMTPAVHTCRSQDHLDEMMTVMTEHRIRHVPVVDDDGTLVGIISIGDVVKHKISTLEFERDQLDHYVHQT